MEPSPTPNGPAAGIVAFGPNPASFRALLSALAPSVERVFIFVNGLFDAALRTEVERAYDHVHFIWSEVNLGVGAGLNALASEALRASFGTLIVFDQDSRPEMGLVKALSTARASLIARGERPAAIGPRLVPPAGTGHKGPRYRVRRGAWSVGSLTPVEFLPTSGTLLDLSAYGRVGPFRDDYFIDAIDLEWCMRAWARGHSCWVAQEVAMAHPIGEGAYEAKALGLRTPRQKAFRMYSYVRNNVYGLRLPHVLLTWKLRQLLYIPAQLGLVFWKQGFDPAVLTGSARAARDGFMGRLGPPPGAALTRSEDRDPPPLPSGSGNNTGPGEA